MLIVLRHCFDPRAREGRDFVGDSPTTSDDVSIRAPVKGATDEPS